ncbi:hypothetical protein HY571_02100 [Candidatus Micrarchaeota archaeon]|nr:hypothetical protein [Candidatus Micrarchaeota archaeon]
MVHRILWLKIGGRRFHLLKLAGAFFVFAAVLKVAESAYQIFVTANKAVYAQVDPTLIPHLFGWAMGAQPSGGAFLTEDLIGVLLGPVAVFLFWLGIAVLAVMVYQAGKVVLPVEEYEQIVREKHKALIKKALAAHKHKR